MERLLIMLDSDNNPVGGLTTDLCRIDSEPTKAVLQKMINEHLCLDEDKEDDNKIKQMVYHSYSETTIITTQCGYEFSLHPFQMYN